MGGVIGKPERLLADHPGERLCEYMRNLYYTPFYGLYKTEVFREVMKRWLSQWDILGGDMIAMAYLTMKHKWVYCEQARYITRDKFVVDDGNNRYLESYMDAFKLSQDERARPHNRLGRLLLAVMDEHLALDAAEKKDYIELIKEEFAKKSAGLNFSW